jgi:hypothetical protein
VIAVNITVPQGRLYAPFEFCSRPLRSRMLMTDRRWLWTSQSVAPSSGRAGYHLRFLSIGSRLCSTLPSDPASQRCLCASLALQRHPSGQDSHLQAVEHARHTTNRDACCQASPHQQAWWKRRKNPHRSLRVCGWLRVPHQTALPLQGYIFPREAHQTLAPIWVLPYG